MAVTMMAVVEKDVAWYARLLPQWGGVADSSYSLQELRRRKELAGDVLVRMRELGDVLEKAKSHLNVMKHQLK
jgi:hypothetical protein